MEKEYIKITYPGEINTKAFKSKIKSLALKGIRSKNILLEMKFITDKPELLIDEFKRIKNKIYLGIFYKNIGRVR